MIGVQDSIRDVRAAQRHLDECIDRIGPLATDIFWLKWIVMGAAATVCAALALHAWVTYTGKPYETARPVPYPTTPYEGGLR